MSALGSHPPIDKGGGQGKEQRVRRFLRVHGSGLAVAEREEGVKGKERRARVTEEARASGIVER
jgi:hypothetical protein